MTGKDGRAVSRLRRAVTLTVALSLVAGVLLVVSSMSQAQVAFWFGETVNHCPNMDISCPSNRPGVLMLLFVPAMLLLAISEVDDD